MPDSTSVQETTPSTPGTLDLEQHPKPNPSSPNQYQWNPKTLLLLTSVFLSVFVVGIDRTIISTAIPRITDTFSSLPDLSWYSSIYLLTSCAFQLLFGKLYTLYPVKIILLTSILIFEVASGICGAAPSSEVFIFGRALAGVGGAGIFAGTIVSVVHVVPLEKRPTIQGIMGAVMGVATILGPLVGGAFTSHVSWRWCFYINLPIGAMAMAAIYFFLDIPSRESTSLPWTKKVKQLDGPGTVFLVPGVVCLLLALQWGGQLYRWSNERIIILLTLAGMLLLAFIATQIFLPKTATLPPRIIKQRSVVAGLWATFFISSSQYIFVYFLPIWFQSILSLPPLDSGIRLLPLLLSMVIASMLGGFANQKLGYYTPLAIAGCCIMCVGAGLLTTLQLDASEATWFGYQVLYGFGMGLCFQTPNLAVQTVLPKEDVAMGLALMLFGQLIGAAMFVAVGENVLASQLLKRLEGVKGVDRTFVLESGATSLLSLVSEDQRGMILGAYNEALRKVFQVGLILACLAVLGTAGLEWRSVLKKPKGNLGAEKIKITQTEREKTS